MMETNRARYWANVSSALFLICLVAWGANAQSDGTDNANVALIRERIQKIMRQTIKSGENVVMSDGRQVIARTFIPPSNLAIDEVKGYGDTAVPILAEYLSQPSGFEKYHAMRFLGAIGGRKVVEPLRQVALHDRSAGYREYALAFLTQTPWELAAPILREAASSDPELRVRNRASELLNGYAPR
jgi:hypothetical protein